MRPESSENLISLPVVTPPRRGKPAKSRMSKVRFTVLIIIQLLIIAHVVQCESLAITAEGVDAVRDLGAGDMRRTLNILQSSFLAKAGAGAVEADGVYATTGQPRPGDIEAIAGMLLNLPFAEAVEQVSATKTARGLALGDICKLLCEYVFRLHMPPAARADLVSDLADVEHRLAYVTGERLQLLALVGAFVKAKEAIVQAAE